MFIIGVYIDLAGESTKKIEEVKHTLSTKFNMKDLGELNHFFGVQVIWNCLDWKTPIHGCHT